MCLEARLSQNIGFIGREEVSEIEKLVESFGLPSQMPADIGIDRILSSMQLDKKAVAGELRFILPEKIGKVRIHKGIAEKAVKDLLES